MARSFSRRGLLKLGSTAAAGFLVPSLGQMGIAQGRPRPPFMIYPMYDQDPINLEGRERKKKDDEQKKKAKKKKKKKKNSDHFTSV